MYSLGVDIGSSSVKVSLLEIATGLIKSSAQSPEVEMPITAVKTGYAEQHPDLWWQELKNAIKKLITNTTLRPEEVQCIGITYQMHGLVMINNSGEVIRPAIIWCDSRAVESGNNLSLRIGSKKCNERLLNQPGNFTASKLFWVKENESKLYAGCMKVMLPGDWIAYKMTGGITTTMTGLSEGTLWDFRENKVADFLLKEMDVSEKLIPEVVPVFGKQGILLEKAAEDLGLKAGTPVTYRSGDQPNNAFSLNVLEPGEVAATAGTSGVVYAVTEKFDATKAQGVNAFAHVNHTRESDRLGVLLCINGTGIANSWVRKLSSASAGSYEEMNGQAEKITPGSEGISFLPFGNGAERMLGNRDIGASIHGINFNIHNHSHIYRSVQEGIAFAFYYGIKKMQEGGVVIHTLKAGKANLFQSRIFTKTLSAITNCRILLYNTDGAAGAARGAALGAGFYSSSKDCFENLNLLMEEKPDETILPACKEAYERWEKQLDHQLKQK